MYRPEVIYIETTSRCNAACIMCPHKNMKRSKLTMSDETFSLTLKRLSELDPKGVQIFMHKEGEPLLDPKITDRISAVKHKVGNGNEIAINTNAMLLNECTARKLIASGLDTVYFSVDGYDRESYARIRIGLNYYTVADNIRRFLALRDEMRSPVRVIMQTLIQGDDDSSGEKFRRVWESYRCEFYVKRMHGYLDGGHSSQTQTLSPTQLNTCDDPSRILVIYSDGNTGLCCWDYNNEYCTGNIADESLLGIFNGTRAARLREAIGSYNGSSVSPCNRCARIFGSDSISTF